MADPVADAGVTVLEEDAPESGLQTRLSDMADEELDALPSLEAQKSIRLDQANLRASEGVLLDSLQLENKDEVNLGDVLKAVRQRNAAQGTAGLLKRIVGVFAGFAVLLIIGMFVTSYMAIEMSKESRVGQGAVLTSTAGDVVRVGSADFAVAADGTLRLAPEAACRGQADCARRLQEGGSAPVVATQVKRQQQLLHSAMSDSFFDALEEVTIHSEKGHKLNLKVHGFSRVPALHSRCGNVLYLFTAVDGHITLDSTDLSFSGHLESLFKKAGFEIAVGGAAGRRLAGATSVQGFFNHVEQMTANNEWNCAGVPAPLMPKMSLQNSTTYMPCAAAISAGKVNKETCDSVYGGQLAGVKPLPEAYLPAVMGRLDRIKLELGHGFSDVASVLYVPESTVLMRSPSYEVQRTYMPAHPLQESVSVVDKVQKAGLSFQFSPDTENNGRYYCKDTNMTDNPVLRAADADAAGVDTNVHFEFMGLFEGPNGQLLRHFRMMAADDFLKWMEGDSKVDKPKEAYFEYWDDANTLEARMLLGPLGDLTVFHEVRTDLTDAEVEEFLNETMPNYSGPYPAACTTEELGEYFIPRDLPRMLDAATDLSVEELSYYANLLANDDMESTDAAGGENESISVGWSSVALMTPADRNYDFAAYALRSKSPFAMMDACASACAGPLEAVKKHTGGSKDGLCAAPQLHAAVQCFKSLAMPLNMHCLASPFSKVVHEECAVPVDAASSRRLSDTADAHVLPDGSKALELSKLSPELRQELVKELAIDDLSKARLVFNQSAPGAALTDVVAETPTAARRLLVEDCTDPLWPYMRCIAVSIPRSCKKNCRFKLKVSFGLKMYGPFALTIEIGGCANVAEAFGIPPPLAATICGKGGISVTSKAACPGQVNFGLSGYVGVSASLGLDFGFVNLRIAGIDITVTVSIAKSPGYHRWISTGGRRRSGWGRRRRRRRRRGYHQWVPPTCDLLLSGDVTLTVGPTRAGVVVDYFFWSKLFRVRLKTGYYEFWKLWWGKWKDRFWTVYQNR